jgi:hypothetical protein
MEEKPGPLDLAKLVVLTPDSTKLSYDLLKKPFILTCQVPREARLLDVRSLPNIMEAMGMQSGGGPPGFSTLIPKMKVKQPKRRLLIAGFLPGAEIVMHSRQVWLGDHVGTCTSAGLVLNYFEFVLTNEANEAAQDTKAVHALIEENGYAPVPLVEYTTPEVFLRGMATPPPGAI